MHEFQGDFFFVNEFQGDLTPLYMYILIGL
jgi:hypothetical protein